MRIVTLPSCALCVAAILMFGGGCSKSGPTTPAPIEISGPPPSGGHGDHDHDGHDHDAHGHDEHHAGHNHANEHHGPHHGPVIELGRSHEYHAELVEDEEAKTVTIYILDKNLKEFAIEQSSIVMNLVVHGEAETFELSATEASDGRTSRFDASDEALFRALHEHKASGKLRVTINGMPYSGEVEHHDHHGRLTTIDTNPNTMLPAVR